MKRINNMNAIEIKELLKFDSLYRVLRWEDRIHLHRVIVGKEELQVNLRIERAIRYIEKYRIELPSLKYGQDLYIYYENEEGEWKPVEKFIQKTTNDEIKLMQYNR